LNNLNDTEVIETYIGNKDITNEEISAKLLIQNSIEIFIGSSNIPKSYKKY